MADEEHVDRLRKDAGEWNKWRRSGRQLLNLRYADLAHADLHDLDLRGANLRGADLSDANLSGANLHRVHLSGAYLIRANLSGANLSQAELNNADLTNADLSNADLRQARLNIADLTYVNLNGADLSNANLSGAIMNDVGLSGTDLGGVLLYETVFGDTDLGVAKGLRTCRHAGPSVIDFRTLAKSLPLPLEFLRGVGLPDNVIDYLPSLLNQPIQYYSCFISYSSKDDDFAKRIHADLQSKGVRCWFASHDLPIGGKILDEIDAAIRLRDKVLLILSEHSIGSDWVEDEVKAAYEEERKRGQTMLFPVRLDDAVMETKEAWATKLRADRNIGDFRQWKDHDRYRDVFERVLRDLAAGPKKPG